LILIFNPRLPQRHLRNSPGSGTRVAITQHRIGVTTFRRPIHSTRHRQCGGHGDGKTPLPPAHSFHLAIDAIWFYK
jgi:hypothetical protein